MVTESPKQQREIAIFWDYENVPLPSYCTAPQAAKAIVNAVSQYGRIVDRRLYYDFEKMNYRPRDCSSLDSSGFDLVNTPTRNNKETLDKKLIADVLTFAWDSAVRNDNKKPCVVLLTGDGDYAYTLSKLRDRGIMTVVMVGKDCTVASILVDTADVAMSLEDDVLSDIAASQSSSSTTALSKRIAMFRTPSSNSLSRTHSSSHNGNHGDDDDSLMFFICRSIKVASELSEDGWTDFGRVALQIQQAIRKSLTDASPATIKETVREARQEAETHEFIEIGRRKQNPRGSKREIVPNNEHTKAKLSNELYTRLLPKGEQVLHGTSNEDTQHKRRPKSPPVCNTSSLAESPQDEQTRILFVHRLSLNTHVQDLVSSLQDTFHVSVRRAQTEASKSGRTLNAYVEFFDEKDAAAVLNDANNVFVAGKLVAVAPATRSHPFKSTAGATSEGTFYENENEPKGLKRGKPTSAKSSSDRSIQDDTSDDTEIFCRSIHTVLSQRGLEMGAADAWASLGAIGARFRSHLPPTHANKTATKDIVKSRFRQARKMAIQEGLVEMGRQMHDGSFVSVPFDDNGSLPRESHFRLLQLGQALVSETESPCLITESTAMKSTSRVHVYMNNLPPEITATELARYLEKLECHAQRIELQHSRFKSSAALAAHIECVDTEDASKILARAHHGGLVCLGRSVYATWNRITPEQVTHMDGRDPNRDMSYTRHDLLSTAMAPDVESMVSSLLSDEASLPPEEQSDKMIDNSASATHHTTHQDCTTSSTQRDPFEDLISFT